MNKTVDPIKMYVERYRHTVENTPREVGQASRNLSFFGGIFGWDVAFTLNAPLQMTDMLPFAGGSTWKRSATMSQSAECGAAVIPEWYASLPKHDTV